MNQSITPPRAIHLLKNKSIRGFLIIIALIFFGTSCFTEYSFLTIHKEDCNQGVEVNVYKVNDVLVADSVYEANFGVSGFVSKALEKSRFIEIRTDNFYLYSEKRN